MPRKRPHRRLPWWGAVGVLLFLAGVFCLVRDVERWNAVWYVPAWYGYLLVLDAAIFRLQGRSPLADRPREVVAWMLWSVPFWFLFEAYNLRLRNWYYVFALRSTTAAAVFGVAAFATVIPACFFHAEAVRALGAWHSRRCRPLEVTRGVERAILALGLLSIAAPLAWPRVAFPLVWGATLWVPELLNRRAGAPSLLADLEAGRCERLLQLLTGGLWAGVVWETFNFLARCKWIYTVPGFEDWKLFEMPLAGFLGFPVLAVAAFSFYSLVSRLSSREGLRTSAGRLRLIGLAVAAVALSAASFRAMLERTVESRRPLLSELAGIDAESEARLRRRGVATPELLLRAIRREGEDALAADTGVSPARLAKAAGHAALSIHKGMGAADASLLSRSGITTVAELATLEPEALFERLRALAAAPAEDPPRLAQIEVWVRAARFSGRPRR